MGSACTICKSEGDSYDLNLVNNKIQQQPIGHNENCEKQVAEPGAAPHAKTTNQDIEDSSSSKDVNLQVVEERKSQALEDSKHEVKKVQETCEVSSDAKMADLQSSSISKKIVKAGHSNTTQNDYSKLDHITEDEANKIVNDCWERIEKTCDDMDVKKPGDTADAVSAGWRVVRLFVSSTFTDYHAERELLVKKVFPELREWCEERHLQLIECDLRWGVPKDTTTAMTIKTCLSELDRCKEECNGAPFFLNMLGERYGWMPSQTEIPQDVQDQYQWVFPVSITHMEILHAAYRANNANAAFFIREPGFIEDIPSTLKPAFVDEFALNKASLKMLKRKLKERFPGQVFDYACEYDGIDESTGKEKVKLKGLADFGEAVLNHFKSCIGKTFPVSQKELTPEEKELVSQDNFIKTRGSLLLGRTNEVDSILEYANNGSLPGQTVHGSACPMLLVQGVPGSGKSSLMAYCTLKIKNEMGILLFYHFVGSGPGSTDALKLSNRLYSWLKNITSQTAEAEEEKEDEEIPLHEMQEKMQNVIKEVAKLDKTVVIIIDAVNQLSDAENTEHLNWVPLEIPLNVHFILSAVKQSRSSVILLSDEKRPDPFDLFIGELDDFVKKEIVNHILGIYNKKLDDQQMALLIAIEGASNPLWLSLSCEELRVFGVFERVTMHIQSMPSFLEGLLQFILKRLISEDEFNNVEKVLCALFCMSLTETELRYLLSETSDEPLPMLKWALVRRTLKPFLRNTGQQGEEERLDYFHASISNLVKGTIMTDSSEKQKWHLKIADYFQYICKDDRRATEAVAVQLKNAENKKRLLEFLKKDVRAQRKSPVWKSQFYKYIMCGRMIPQIKDFREEVSLCQMCSMQHKGLGQIAGLNKDACVICGNFVAPFWRKPEHVAMVCQQHKPRHAPGQVMCFICSKPAFFNSQTAYTCMVCSAGFQKCVKMVV